MTPRLSLRNITKRYGPVVANDHVSLDVMPGEIVALLGENGAGKSTLMKVAYGVAQPDHGTVTIDGAPIAVVNPKRARSLGMAMVFQQFALFESATVLENIALGLPPEPISALESRLRTLAPRYGLQIDPLQRVHDCSVGERQRIELLRALLGSPRLLILDEPTSVLTPQAVDRLFDALRQLAGDGVSIVFISHKLHEIRKLATRCVVMRAGAVVAEVDPRVGSESALARLMLGTDPPILANHDAPRGGVVLRVRQLRVTALEEHHPLRSVSFDVRSGEIVGIAGISGNGQGTLMAALAGELVVEPEAIRLFDQPVGHLNTAMRRALGLRYVPEQRLGHGAVAGMSLEDNARLTDTSLQKAFLLDATQARDDAVRVIKQFGVQCSSTTQKAETLSGGNLQKYIVGREVMHAPRVLLVAQPTWGVDAGSAMSIRNELIVLRDAGCAIVVVSEELDELYQLCDRLLVMANGRVSPPRATNEIDSAELGRWMAGLWLATHDDAAAMEPAA
ncbi:MAG: ABC transporter ATP-binding protein [Burkholderiaceae bacterium]